MASALMKWIVGCVLLAAGTAWAQAEDRAEADGWWSNLADSVKQIRKEGDWDIYFSGYAYHSRSTYTDKRISTLNENAWGGGFGKTWRNEKGNDESLYIMAIRDSHKNIQWSGGYAYHWMWPVSNSGRLEAGAGITGVIIRRHDWYDGRPFPALLPTAAVGTQDVKLSAVYVPRISSKRGKGDVVLVFLKFTL